MQRHVRRSIAAAIVRFALLVSLPWAASAATSSEGAGDVPLVDAGRAEFAKWVETQQLLAKEKKDWQQGKEILQSRIGLVNNEIAAMEAKLAELQTSAHEADSRRAETSAQDETLRQTAGRLAAWAGELEGDIRRLYARLPEPVQAKLKPLHDRIPDDPARTSVSVAERLQNIVGILNQVNKANNEITLATEVRALSDGRPAEVRTVYVGLAQAYYVSATGAEAGIGRPSTAGWQWQSANELAPSVLQVVEVLQNKAKPMFVSLPVKVQ
jgi:hypothetical protein